MSPETRKAVEALSGLDRWMVQQNLRYCADRGVDSVVQNLRAQGYSKVATAVQLMHSEGLRFAERPA